MIIFPAGDCCLRAGAEDQTNGFFVAVFERTESVAYIENTTTTTTTTTNSVKKFNVDQHARSDSNKRNNHKKHKRRHLPVTSHR